MPRPKGGAAWLKLGAALALAALPLILWQDYLRALYRSTSAVGHDQLDLPSSSTCRCFSQTLGQTSAAWHLLAALKLGVIVSLTVQTAYLIYRRHVRVARGGAWRSRTRC